MTTGMDLSQVDPRNLDHALERMLRVLPLSIKTLFDKGDLYFVYKNGGKEIHVEGEQGVPRSVVENITDKIQSYMKGQPYYFLGLELETEH